MSIQTQTARPFFKWAGGKRAIISQIRPFIPAIYGTYHEPFLGGGALFYALAPTKATLSDCNADLITTYQAVRDTVDNVIARLRVHEKHHGADYYKVVRAQHPTSTDEIAARFLYLNRTCFNGLYRVNRAGNFNVPMGRYADPHICDPDLLHQASRALQGQAILCAPFQDIHVRASAGDLVYFDPPYMPLSVTSDFTSYTADGFSYADHITLRDTADALVARGVHVLISNADTPLVRDLYKNWRIVPITAPRAINSNTTRRGMVSEILAIGGKTHNDRTHNNH